MLGSPQHSECTFVRKPSSASSAVLHLDVGAKCNATEGCLHREPTLFQFGTDYTPRFIAANRRAAARREWLSASERSFNTGQQPTGLYGQI